MSHHFSLLLVVLVDIYCIYGLKKSYHPHDLMSSISVSIRPTETVNITTRDNYYLSTDIYLPKLQKGPFATIYEATPYTKESLSDNAEFFVSLGYAYIGQDFRGTSHSNGPYSFWRTSGNDSIDTLEWLEKQSWSNGLVGTFGVSADAVFQYTSFSGVTDYYNEPNSTYYNKIYNHIKVEWNVVAISIARQAVYQNGAYREGLISGWLEELGFTDYIQTVLKHEVFDTTDTITGDLYWEPISGQYRNQWDVFNVPMVHLAGFYDIFSTNQIRTAMAINASSNRSAVGQQILFIEPGGHCGKGAITWPNQSYALDLLYGEIMPSIYEAVFNDSENNQPFNIHDYVDYNLLFYVLGPGTNTGSKTIENGNYWVQSESFPTYNNKYFYLSNNNMLQETKQSIKSDVSFIYNPKNPVPTEGGNNLIVTPCGPQDQRKIERDRTDILHFTSSILNNEIGIVGLITVNLFVSSNVTDTDFTAKLIDIFPNGKHMLVQDGILRMRWRNGAYSDIAEAMKSNEIYNVIIEIGIMSYIFNIGHQISVSISSSNYPRFSQNWNSGKMVIDGDIGYKIADNTVHFGGQYDSSLILPMIDMQWIRQRKV